MTWTQWLYLFSENPWYTLELATSPILRLIAAHLILVGGALFAIYSGYKLYKLYYEFKN